MSPSTAPALYRQFQIHRPQIEKLEGAAKLRVMRLAAGCSGYLGEAMASGVCLFWGKGGWCWSSLGFQGLLWAVLVGLKPAQRIC